MADLLFAVGHGLPAYLTLPVGPVFQATGRSALV